MASLAPVIRQRFLDADGNPLAGGLLYSYLAGTTTPAATYTDVGGLTPNTNPIVLDANGEANVWLGDFAYKFKLADADDVVQWTVDNVTAPGVDPDIDPSDAWVKYTCIENGETILETVNSASYCAAIYEFVFRRGTTVFSSGQFAIHHRNGAWELATWSENMNEAAAASGVTITLYGTTTASVRADVNNSGAGEAYVHLKRTLIPN